MSGALVVLSGGQDSTTALYWARRTFGKAIHAITYDYGQRHRSEIDAARRIAIGLPIVSHEVVTFAFPASSALTDRFQPVDAGGGYLGLPSTFTPGRNALFLTRAAIAAQALGVHHLVTGVCQTDFSGYPDCRRPFVDALQHALALGMEWPLQIHTPIMYLTKAETVKLAASLEGCFRALGISITCYHGTRPGCGECPACLIRARGFADAGYEDPARSLEALATSLDPAAPV